MTATAESTSPFKAALDALNDAANAKHAIEATADELADTINFAGNARAIGMFEALRFSVRALDEAIGNAMALIPTH